MLHRISTDQTKWNFTVSDLKSISGQAEKYDVTVGLEETEAIVLALVDLGYLIVIQEEVEE